LSPASDSPIYRYASRSSTIRAVAFPFLTLRRQYRRARERPRLRIYRNLCDLLADDPVIHLEEFGGDFQIDARSDLFRRCLLGGYYETRLVRLCKAHVELGRDAVDVGANVGFFTVFFAHALPEGRVLAVEPLPGPARRLRANVRRNGVAERVVIFEGAATERRTRVQLQYVEGREEYATLGTLVHPSVADAGAGLVDVAGIETDAARLDDLIAEQKLRPGIIKVDVEGAECRVLRGARDTLRTHRPVLLVEVAADLLEANGSSVAEVLDLLRGAGYRLTDAENSSVEPGRRPFGEILALPEELRTDLARA
jgi:FkbM family methyltransferase